MLILALSALIILVAPLVKANSRHHGWLPRYQSTQALYRRGGSTASEQTLNTTYLTFSIHSVAGERQYMEDEYFVSPDGGFAGVFDGHGGRAVSRCVAHACLVCFVSSIRVSLFSPTPCRTRYLRQNLYASYQAFLPSSPKNSRLSGGDDSSGVSGTAASSALQSAFTKVDQEVQEIVHWSFQGSHAL